MLRPGFNQTDPALVVQDGDVLACQVGKQRFRKDIRMSQVDHIRRIFFDLVLEQVSIQQIEENLLREEPGTCAIVQFSDDGVLFRV